MTSDKITNIILFFSLLALSSCNQEELPNQSDRLYIRAAATSFSQTGDFSTKAENIGFLTAFEAGDQIGVTGIDAQGNVLDVCNNIRFTYQEDIVENGVVWSSFLNDRGYGFVEKVNGATYFAYYPYDPQWDGEVLDNIIANFTVLEDQSTKENFCKSDLMTTDEAISPSVNELRFVLNHKMATISLFYNNEWEPDGITPKYQIKLYDGTTPSSLTIDHSYRAIYKDPVTGNTVTDLRRRYLVDPRNYSSVKLIGCLEEESYRYFSKSLEIQPGYLYSFSFEGAPLVPYTDGVDLELDDVEFEDRDGNIVTLGHTVIWSKYNLGESVGETYPFEPASGDRGARTGTRDPYARGDYYCWGATYTQYDNGLSGYNGYGYNNYFDNEYKIAPLGGTIKETEYDVAHAKWWRGKWRLPTENEFRALYAGCTFELEASYSESLQRYLGRTTGKTTYYVIKVTNRQKPEKYIYFSTGGYSDGTMEKTVDEEGNVTDSGDGKKNNGIVSPSTAFYLSSTASPTTLRCISYAYFNVNEQHIKIDGSRYTGMLVRPVYSPNEANVENP
ncbi:MAG: fimbrillin family protein [Candidatus Cryptobacteroides sp.]